MQISTGKIHACKTKIHACKGSMQNSIGKIQACTGDIPIYRNKIHRCNLLTSSHFSKQLISTKKTVFL